MSKIRGLLRTFLHPKDELKMSETLYYASLDCIGICGQTITAVFETQAFALMAGRGAIANLFASHGWTVSPNLCPKCRVSKVSRANEILLYALSLLSYPNDEFRRQFIFTVNSLARDDRGDPTAVSDAETAAEALLIEINSLHDSEKSKGVKNGEA